MNVISAEAIDVLKILEKSHSFQGFFNTFAYECLSSSLHRRTIFFSVEYGKIYTVVDIIEAGSSYETYILEERHPGNKDKDRILAYSACFVGLDEWREIQLKKIGL